MDNLFAHYVAYLYDIHTWLQGEVDGIIGSSVLDEATVHGVDEYISRCVIDSQNAILVADLQGSIGIFDVCNNGLFLGEDELEACIA